jgi:hypothetical protein
MSTGVFNNFLTELKFSSKKGYHVIVKEGATNSWNCTDGEMSLSLALGAVAPGLLEDHISEWFPGGMLEWTML